MKCKLQVSGPAGRFSFSDILGQRFDPVVDALMPPGANDED
jgi:hypothetical protein